MEYNDFELVSLAQENNEEAIEILYKKYNDLIQRKAKRVLRILKGSGIELSDIIQEALIGFDEAIRKFNQNDDTIFFTFAIICIDGRIKTFILKQNRGKYRFLNEAVNFENRDSECNLLDLLSDNVTPESLLFNDVSESEIYIKIKNGLTGFEDVVFELKIQGYEYKEIANILDIDSKDIYNAINRIRIKTKKILGM